MALQCSLRSIASYIRLANAVPVRLENGRLFPISARQRYYSAATPEDSTSKAVAATKATTATQKLARLTDHKVDRLEKYILVWGGKYKSVDEVPNLVSQDTLERARNKARIKINLMMIGATVVGCLIMIWLGKKAQKDGQSVVQMNEEWHKKMREEGKENAK